jgi:nitrogen fixation NifU-like protein
MEHYTNPRFKKNVSSDYAQDNFHSTVCVDKMLLGIKISDDMVKDVVFEGEGCAIFLSSVDIFLESIIGLSIKEVKILIEQYQDLINQKLINNEAVKNLNKLNVFAKVKTHLNRLKCAELIVIGLKKLI